jgi:hypothetical protein
VSFIWLSLQHFCILHCNICASVTFMQIFVHLFILIFYYYIHDVIYASFTTNIHYLICIHTSSLFLYSTSSSGLAKLSIIAWKNIYETTKDDYWASFLFTYRDDGGLKSGFDSSVSSQYVNLKQSCKLFPTIRTNSKFVHQIKFFKAPLIKQYNIFLAFFALAT